MTEATMQAFYEVVKYEATKWQNQPLKTLLLTLTMCGTWCLHILVLTYLLKIMLAVMTRSLQVQVSYKYEPDFSQEASTESIIIVLITQS